MKRKAGTLLAVGIALVGAAFMSCTGSPQDPGSLPALQSVPLLAMDRDSDAVQSVTGNAHITDPEGGRTVVFNILRHPDGSVSGWYHALGRFPEGANIRVRVECLHVNGNRAWAKGTIVDAVNPDNIGRPCSMRFIDNGEGAGALPDEFGGIWTDFDCTSEPDISTRQLTIGNVMIRG